VGDGVWIWGAVGGAVMMHTMPLFTARKPLLALQGVCRPADRAGRIRRCPGSDDGRGRAGLVPTSLASMGPRSFERGHSLLLNP